MPEPSNTSQPGYFTFAVSQGYKAEYLRLVMQQGGTAVSTYKQMSFDLLELGPGMQVLDVGCGIGIDLLALADRVGTQGVVTGIDHDPDLVQVALKTITTDGRRNLQVVQGDAEQMPFAKEILPMRECSQTALLSLSERYTSFLGGLCEGPSQRAEHQLRLFSQKDNGAACRQVRQTE